ncbi:MAG: RsiV family protein [Bacteroidales bacterium]
MSHKLSSRTGFLPVLFFLLTPGFSQDGLPDIFYRHYTGILDTTMNLTFDLFSFNGKIEGYYYYGFQIPGSEGGYQYGKTIPITGVKDGSNFSIQEAFNPSSRFVGTFHQDDQLTGKWERKVYQKEIPFTLKVNHANENIPLKAYHIIKEKPAITLTRPNENVPKAIIEILILYPEKASNPRFKEVIDQQITRFMFNVPQAVTSVELLMENIVFDFFQSYHHHAEGVENIRELSSFNWKKTLSMEVIYNSNYLLTLRFMKHAYSGGGQGISIQENHVFDIQKGKKLELSDILKDGFESQLNFLLDKKFRSLNGLKRDESLRLAGFLIDQIEYTGNFFVTNDGIGFYYNVYEVAPYSTGTTELFIPFYELQPLLKQDHPFTWTSFGGN